TTQLRSSKPLRSAAIFGSAVATIVWSSAASSVASMIALNAIRTSRWDLVSVAIELLLPYPSSEQRLVRRGVRENLVGLDVGAQRGGTVLTALDVQVVRLLDDAAQLAVLGDIPVQLDATRLYPFGHQ